MDNMLMIGLSRQIVLRREMDVTANNIANANTAGFKAERVLLEEETRTPARAEDGPRRLSYVDEWGLGRNFAQGALDPTGRPLDFALEGEGFFAVETGSGETLYTRDGRFTINADSELAASDGARVLSDQGLPVLIDREGGPISVDEDGTIVQGGVPIGRIGVTSFETLSRLEKTGDNRYRAPDDLQPEPVLAPVVRQGAVENSNVTPISEIVRMINVSRAYQSVSKLIEDADRLTRDAVERIGRPNA